MQAERPLAGIASTATNLQENACTTVLPELHLRYRLGVLT